MRGEEIQSRGYAKRFRKALTRAETILWSRLKEGRAHGYRFRRQHPIGPYIADFASLRARLVIELDGETHSTDEERAHDARRDAFLSKRGWRVMRFWNSDVYKNLDGVVDAIYSAVRSRL
jgi:very-short-patch-repair endonuclease